MTSIRPYQVTNLLEYGATITEAPPSSETNHVAENLITNLSSRGVKFSDKPYIDDSGNTANHYSCYRISHSDMATVGHQFVLTIRLAKSYMQHAILLLEDNRQGETQTSSYNWYALFQNYEIYIGDSTDWSQNTKCPGGPFMRYDDPSSFSVDPLYG